jgi:UDP-N-acetylmuramyl pentapeptide synthase
MDIRNLIILKQLLKPKTWRNVGRFCGINGFTYDSRNLRKGQVFIAVKGRFRDGHDFILEADKKGAGLIVAERLPDSRAGRLAGQAGLPDKGVKAPDFLVEDSRYALKYWRATCVISKTHMFMP